MLSIKYKNRVIPINIDRHTTIEEFCLMITNIFSPKGKIIGFQDSDGKIFYPINDKKVPFMM